MSSVSGRQSCCLAALTKPILQSENLNGMSYLPIHK